VVNLIKTVLNNSLSMSLNRRALMQIFSVHAETTPLALMLKDNVPIKEPL
jgi:hypothetical protein